MVKPILGDLADVTQSYKGPGSCPFKRLWAITLRVLALQPARDVFIIIDALERVGSSKEEQKEFFESLDHLSSLPKVRVALLSRKRLDLSSSLMVTWPCLELTSELLAPDIARFAAAKFDSLGIPQQFKEVTMQRIHSMAGGSYIWVECLLEYLWEPCDKDDYLKRLRGCPPGIWPFYDLMMKQAVWAKSKSQQQSFSRMRHNILTLLAAAQQPLGMDEVAKALEFGPYSADRVLDYCRPLLSVKNSRLHFIHHSAKEYLLDESRRPTAEDDGYFVSVSPEESHEKLAWQCLQCLTDSQYASPLLIGQYLHRNFEMAKSLSAIPRPSKGVSFEYSAKNFDCHLIAISNPSDDLLVLLNQFLHGLQFAYWCEWSRMDTGNMSRALGVFLALRSWLATLPEDKQQLVTLTDYFTEPYSTLRAIYQDSEGQDRELQWLALMRIGRFYVDSGETTKATPIRRQVSDGISRVLGTLHPLTLVARTDWCLGLTFEERYEEALAELQSVAEVAETVLGRDNTELYRIFLAKGEVELYMVRFADAAATLEASALGYLKLMGPDNKTYLGTWMWSCLPLIQIGELDEALRRLKTVYEKRKEQYGAGDLFNSMTQFLMGVVYRRQSKKAESLMHLRGALETRRKIFSLSEIWSMDPAIELAAGLWDFGETAAAHQVLAELERDGQLDRVKFFKRKCQVTHLRGLLDWKAGRRDRAISLLQGLLIDVDREDYNRALLWAALDLAKILRGRGRKDDERQASAIFGGILVDLNRSQHEISPGAENEEGDGDHPNEEPDPPRLLRFAEEALTLVREQRFAEVDDLFRKEEVGWYREKDIWLWSGGPSADTTWLRSPLEGPKGKV